MLNLNEVLFQTAVWSANIRHFGKSILVCGSVSRWASHIHPVLSSVFSCFDLSLWFQFKDIICFHPSESITASSFLFSVSSTSHNQSELSHVLRTSPFPSPSLRAMLIFGLKNIGLLLHIPNLQKPLGVFRVCTGEARCPGLSGSQYLKRKLPSFMPLGCSSSVGVWHQQTSLNGCCGFLRWLWIQNSNYCLNTWPSTPLRGPLPCLLSVLRTNNQGTIRIQVVQWFGLIPCPWKPSHGYHWGP